MKNLLSLLAALGLTATAATTVIACGSPKNSVVIKKTALKDSNLKTRLKNSVKNQQAAFDSFIKLNAEVDDLEDSVQVIGFTAPDYNQTGTLEIQAKTNSKYRGTLTITIPESNKTDIARLVTNTTIQGTTKMTADKAFQAVLTANSSWANLSDYVDYDAVSFVIPSSTTDGSLTISAKPNSEFSGSLTISINKIVDLNTLNLTAITGVENMSDTEAFNAFLANQNLSNDFAANVTYTFVKPGYATSGSLTINAKPNSQYTGAITIVINAIGQKSLDSLGLNTILSIPVTSQQAAFDLFIKSNAEVNDLADNVQITGFTAPEDNQTGTLVIQAKANSKYRGTLTITIPELNKTDIARLLTNTTIQGDKLMAESDAFQAFLTANSSWRGLDAVVEIESYQAPNDEDGLLIVKAKENTHFTGSVKIVVKKYLVDKENLASTFYHLGTLGWYDFNVPVNTKVQDLIGILNQRIKQLYLDNYGAFADNIADMNTVAAREYPSQAQLNTVGTVWKPSRFDMNGRSWSALRLTVRINYKDGSSEDVIVYDVECSITVVAAQ